MGGNGVAGTEYEVVIGLEIHAELRTASKIFCGCSTAFGAAPNTHVCPVCLGLPGVLPVLNRQAVEYALMAGLALGCKTPEFSKFDRKNYFYPDLPKAYQISQYDLPLCVEGMVEYPGSEGTEQVRILRVHLEEEAGKSVHAGDNIVGSDYSLLDYNRCGIPLIEIVTEPDLRSPEAARLFLEHLKAILQYTGVSDVKMEEGSLRCDANVSLRPRGQQELGTKSEVKNMNSFRAVQRALEFEVRRQEALLRDGEAIVQDTRHWNESRGVTVTMRTKEEADDYRYFPEPDLVPVVVDREWAASLASRLPELPGVRRERFIQEFGLPVYDAGVLTGSKELADFYEACVRAHPDPKTVSNWVMGEYLRLLNAAGVEPAAPEAPEGAGATEATEATDAAEAAEPSEGADAAPVTPEALAKLLDLVSQGTLSGKLAKEVFEEMFATGKAAEEIVEERGLQQISNEGELLAVVDSVIAAHPGPAEDFRNGQDKALGFLVGQIMRETRGKANPQLANSLLRDRLRS